jgi:hypothetical protein
VVRGVRQRQATRTLARVPPLAATTQEGWPTRGLRFRGAAGRSGFVRGTSGPAGSAAVEPARLPLARDRGRRRCASTNSWGCRRGCRYAEGRRWPPSDRRCAAGTRSRAVWSWAVTARSAASTEAVPVKPATGCRRRPGDLNALRSRRCRPQADHRRPRGASSEQHGIPCGAAMFGAVEFSVVRPHRSGATLVDRDCTASTTRASELIQSVGAASVRRRWCERADDLRECHVRLVRHVPAACGGWRCWLSSPRTAEAAAEETSMRETLS